MISTACLIQSIHIIANIKGVETMNYKFDGAISITNCICYGIELIDEDNARYYVFIDGELKKKRKVKIKYNSKGAYITIYKTNYYFNEIVRY